MIAGRGKRKGRKAKGIQLRKIVISFSFSFSLPKRTAGGASSIKALCCISDHTLFFFFFFRFVSSLLLLCSHSHMEVLNGTVSSFFVFKVFSFLFFSFIQLFLKAIFVLVFFFRSGARLSDFFPPILGDVWAFFLVV